MTHLRIPDPNGPERPRPLPPHPTGDDRRTPRDAGPGLRWRIRADVVGGPHTGPPTRRHPLERRRPGPTRLVNSANYMRESFEEGIDPRLARTRQSEGYRATPAPSLKLCVKFLR